ncbi:MAG: YihA family ribosome biogenesis GTP-binding protein [Nitrospinae bacterium]|nr:YihA family ribosome biogenesis GTP-binding protein [Nitrospinota bacterium]
MKVTKAEFITSAADAKGWPPPGPPEIAFAGRSNVGKSSLINSLTGRHGLVKVSKTPGKTQLLNFFAINGPAVTFVDMPGYGFAKVPEAEKRRWGKMIEGYLTKRETFKGLLLLLDVRRKPNEDDFMLLEWLAHHALPTQVVFTKIDKIPKTHRLREIKSVWTALGDLAPERTPLVYSSLSGEGKKELWGAIDELIRG